MLFSGMREKNKYYKFLKGNFHHLSLLLDGNAFYVKKLM